MENYTVDAYCKYPGDIYIRMVVVYHVLSGEKGYGFKQFLMLNRRAFIRVLSMKDDYGPL